MRDYALLAKAFRHCAEKRECASCPMYVKERKCPDFEVRKLAADAIEELLAEVDHLRLKMSAYETDNQYMIDENRKLVNSLMNLCFQKWISVEEMLPEAHKNVLCCGTKGGMFIGWVSGVATVSGGTTTAFVHGGTGRCITHWMPLPEPPKEVE